jgi:competence protein ComGC
LKVYATDITPIPDQYNPRAETAVSINDWHTSHSTQSGYILFNFIIFPIFTWLALLVVFMYINTCAQEPRWKKLESIIEGNDEAKAWACKHQLQNEFTLSLMLVVLSTILAAVAVGVGSKNMISEDKHVSEFYAKKGFTPCLLAFDVFILITVMVTLMILCILKCKKSISNKPNERTPLITKDQTESWWQFCAYSMLFPLCCLSNHFNYIIIAFIHDLYHATSVAIAYGVIILFLYLMLDYIPYVFQCTAVKNMLVLQFIKIGVITLLSAYVVFEIVLFFFIPIRNAFDDAANHIISVYNTTAVLFTTLVLYVIIKHRSTSPIRVFTRAMDSLHEMPTLLNITKEEWGKLSEEDKDTKVAKFLLKKITASTTEEAPHEEAPLEEAPHDKSTTRSEEATQGNQRNPSPSRGRTLPLSEGEPPSSQQPSKQP